MLFQVDMRVKFPDDFDAEQAERLKTTEKAYAHGLQRGGEWRHLWRLVGLYANVSIFDVSSNDRLHEILMGLPLYPFMKITVTPLCRHPSSIRDDDS